MIFFEGGNSCLDHVIGTDHLDFPFRILLRRSEFSGIRIAAFQRPELSDSLGLPTAAVIVFQFTRSGFEHRLFNLFQMGFRNIKFNFVHESVLS